MLFSQTPSSETENAARMATGEMPVYRASVTARTAKAINYQHRSGATKIDFKGTGVLPKARGEAKVESKQGYIEIEVEFDNLEAGKQERCGVSYLCAVGNYSRGPHFQSGRGAAQWNQEQAERHHGTAGIRPGCNR